MKKPLIQAVLLVAAAFVLAIAANAFASRDRRLVLPGYYPGATQVPMHVSNEGPAPSPVVPPAAATTATTTTTVTTSSAAEVAVPALAEPQKPEPPKIVTAPPPSHTEVTKPQTKPQREFAPHPDKPYIEVDGDDAAALHAQGALTLDARRTSIYEDGHIAGARPFPVWESDIDEKVNKLYEERSDPREQLKPILIYCSGGDCEDSHMLAQKLWGIQFNNVYVYKDGFPDWQKRGGAIHKGSKP